MRKARKTGSVLGKCKDCANSEPVTDKWLAFGTGLPTMCGCKYMPYKTLMSRECECGKFEPMKCNNEQL